MSPVKDDAGIDGAEDPDEGTEDAEPEVHEVVSEPAPRKKTSPPRSRPAKKRSYDEEEPAPKSKKKLYAIVIGLIIIVPLIGVIYFYVGPPGNIKKIDLFARPYTKTDTEVSGLALAAFIDTGKPSQLSGTGNLVISYQGKDVYKDNVDVSDSKGLKDVPMNRFAVGNGDYRVQFSFEGFTARTVFSVSEIIEKLNATAYSMTHNTNATLIPDGQARLGFTATFTNIAGVTQLATKNDKLEVEIDRGTNPEKHTENIAQKVQVNNNYTVPGNGNYTVKMTFTNSKVLTTSPYYNIVVTALDSSKDTPYVIVRIPPTSNAGPDKTAQWKIVDGGAVVSFDGTGSVAYEGATIPLASYTWNFGDNIGEDGVAKTSHTYSTPPAAGDTLNYIAILTVTDTNGESSSDTCDVTVTL